MSLAQSIIDGRMQPSTPYSRWTEVSNKRYTATPASTSSITMSDTAGMAVGLPYALTNREEFELKLTKTGGTENSADLAVEIVVVYED